MPMSRIKPLLASAILFISVPHAAVRAQAPVGSSEANPPALMVPEGSLPAHQIPMPADAEIVLPPDQAPVAEAPQKNPLVDAPSPGLSNLLGPAVGHLVPRVDYQATWFPEVPVRAQPTNLSEERQNLLATCPIWQDPCNEWAATLHVRSELYQTSAVLPATGMPFPPDLWNIGLGASYRHLFDNGWIAGGGMSIGSASDKPFHSIDEMTMGVNAFLRIPQGEHNAWLFSLAYSPTSELNFPIPGVAFLWQPVDYLRINVGLPFAVWYRPTEDLTLEASYMLIRSVHAKATYRVFGCWRVYGGYDFSNEGYFLADRPDIRDRFFAYDQHLSAGVQYLLGRQAVLDLCTGYVFDRFFFEGRQFSSNNLNRVNVGDGTFLSLRFDYRF
jgi:hypothetical protein